MILSCPILLQFIILLIVSDFSWDFDLWYFNSFSQTLRNAMLFSACELELCTYGHIADQNIHLNVLAAINVVDNAHPTALSGEAFSNFAFGTGESDENGVPSADLYGRIYPVTPTTNKVYMSRQCVSEFAAGVYDALNHHIFQVVKEVQGEFVLIYGVFFLLYFVKIVLCLGAPYSLLTTLCLIIRNIAYPTVFCS